MIEYILAGILGMIVGAILTGIIASIEFRNLHTQIKSLNHTHLEEISQFKLENSRLHTVLNNYQIKNAPKHLKENS